MKHKELEVGQVTISTNQHPLYTHRGLGTGLSRKQTPKKQVFLGLTKGFLTASKSKNVIYADH